MSLKEKGAVTGIGETAYSRASGKSVLALQLEASLAAIADAGLTPKDIDGIIAYGTATVAEDFITNFGIAGPALLRRPRRWAAPVAVAAIQCAIAAISAGICNHVLIPLGRNGSSGGRIGTRVQQMPQFRTIGEFEMPVGRHRAGAALRADGAPAHGALRHHQPSARRDRRHHAQARARSTADAHDDASR